MNRACCRAWGVKKQELRKTFITFWNCTKFNVTFVHIKADTLCNRNYRQDKATRRDTPRAESNPDQLRSSQKNIHSRQAVKPRHRRASQLPSPRRLCRRKWFLIKAEQTPRLTDDKRITTRLSLWKLQTSCRVCDIKSLVWTAKQELSQFHTKIWSRWGRCLTLILRLTIQLVLMLQLG